MTAIVNLSAIHTLRSIYQGADAFAVLCDKYSNSVFSGCSSFFSHGANYAWVMYRYNQSLNTLINPYKLGRHTTEEFLEDLLKIFPFMADENLKISATDIERLKENKASFWSLHNIDEPNRLHYAKALLEEAWNSIIAFTKEDEKKLRTLLKKETGPIYFISNTNELNVFKIRHWLCTTFQNDFSISLNNSIIVQNDFPMLEIGPEKYMALSYICHTYKTNIDNDNAQVVPSTTPSLLQAMAINVFQGNLGSITVISQYEKDCAAANRLGIDNTYSASEYFQNSPQETISLSA